MTVLLDTHTLLWWLERNPALSQDARDTIADPAVRVLVSPVSAYEIFYKVKLGKLTVPFSGADGFSRIVRQEHWTDLPLSAGHATLAGTHPCHHRDPFDRLLAAQAICEQAALVTIDPAFAGFPDLSTLW